MNVKSRSPGQRFHASSMPARYVKGVVELKLAQLGPMLGLSSAADIGRALAAAGIAPKLLAKSPSPAAAPVSASAPFQLRTETRADGRPLYLRLVPVADIPKLIASGKIGHSMVVVALTHFDLLQRGICKP